MNSESIGVVLVMRSQEVQRQREYGGTGYEIRQVFCSPQPRGLMTPNKHETGRF